MNWSAEQNNRLRTASRFNAICLSLAPIAYCWFLIFTMFPKTSFLKFSEQSYKLKNLPNWRTTCWPFFIRGWLEIICMVQRRKYKTIVNIIIFSATGHYTRDDAHVGVSPRAEQVRQRSVRHSPHEQDQLSVQREFSEATYMGHLSLWSWEYHAVSYGCKH